MYICTYVYIYIYIHTLSALYMYTYMCISVCVALIVPVLSYTKFDWRVSHGSRENFTLVLAHNHCFIAFPTCYVQIFSDLPFLNNMLFTSNVSKV